MYYNTTNETGSKLKASRSKASRQKDVILNSIDISITRINSFYEYSAS